MERNYDFTVGQKVKMKDPDDGTLVFGEVTDKTSDKVFIKWEDLREPCEHERSEFSDIKLV